MNDAEALAGLELRVPVERLAPLPAGHVLPARPGRLRGRDDATGATVGERRATSKATLERQPAGGGRATRGEVLIPLVGGDLHRRSTWRRSGS